MRGFHRQTKCRVHGAAQYQSNAVNESPLAPRKNRLRLKIRSPGEVRPDGTKESTDTSHTTGTDEKSGNTQSDKQTTNQVLLYSMRKRVGKHCDIHNKDRAN